MPSIQAAKTARLPRLNPRTLALLFLFLGLVVSFATNLSQDRKIASLTTDLASVRQDSQKQIAELREAQSALLEQDLLRLDQLNTQLQKSNEDQQHEAAVLANRTRAEVDKTVEQRHQEMIRAISDLRADLRSDAAVKASQSSPVQKPDRAAPRVAEPVAAVDPTAAPLTLISEQASALDAVPPPPARKKGFWSRINPFYHSRNKTQDTAESGQGQ